MLGCVVQRMGGSYRNLDATLPPIFCFVDILKRVKMLLLPTPTPEKGQTLVKTVCHKIHHAVCRKVSVN